MHTEALIPELWNASNALSITKDASEASKAAPRSANQGGRSPFEETPVKPCSNASSAALATRPHFSAVASRTTATRSATSDAFFARLTRAASMAAARWASDDKGSATSAPAGATAASASAEGLTGCAAASMRCKSQRATAVDLSGETSADEAPHAARIRWSHAQGSVAAAPPTTPGQARAASPHTHTPP